MGRGGMGVGKKAGKEYKGNRVNTQRRQKEWFCEEEWKVWGTRSVLGPTEQRTTHSRKSKSPRNK